jgi:hypothetical protein
MGRNRIMGLAMAGVCAGLVSPALAQQDRVSSSEKGSLLIFSKVEVVIGSGGNIERDTFISVTNDFPTAVGFQMYYIGVKDRGLDRLDEEWKISDVGLTLTQDQPIYFSAATGLGTIGVSPFSVIDSDGNMGGTWRGMIYGWAVDANGEPVRHNHLAGHGTIVDYSGWAWEYNSFAFAARNNPAAGGSLSIGNAGDYVAAYSQLLLNFQAAGSTAWSARIPGSNPPAFSSEVVSNTEVTLHPVSADLRENSDADAILTKAQYDVWNENEVKFSGAFKCVYCWNSTLLSYYGNPNHFFVNTLQTNHGKARISGVASPLCVIVRYDNDGNAVKQNSVDAALLGVAVRYLAIDSSDANAAAGSNLVGMGYADAQILYAPLGGPPEAPATPFEGFDRLMKQVGSTR